MGECVNWESRGKYSPIQLDSASMHNSRGEAGAKARARARAKQPPPPTATGMPCYAALASCSVMLCYLCR